uniref:Uncharacterized protein n=1 Tax=Aegilops tauschii subsp. strangulata TaxID=200361 RepID=A0A453GTJ6_AEGTS
LTLPPSLCPVSSSPPARSAAATFAWTWTRRLPPRPCTCSVPAPAPPPPSARALACSGIAAPRSVAVADRRGRRPAIVSPAVAGLHAGPGAAGDHHAALRVPAGADGGRLCERPIRSTAEKGRRRGVPVHRQQPHRAAAHRRHRHRHRAPAPGHDPRRRQRQGGRACRRASPRRGRHDWPPDGRPLHCCLVAVLLE